METTTTIHAAEAGAELVPVPKKLLWTGRVISAVPVLMLFMSAIMKLIKPPQVAEGFTHLGLPETLAIGLGILELVCTAFYLIPRTAVFGAILLTGYLGGAILSHLRVGDPFIGPIIFGVLVWAGPVPARAEVASAYPAAKVACLAPALRSAEDQAGEFSPPHE